MGKAKMDYGDLLVVDPCYIKKVETSFGKITELRFDGLLTLCELHSGDDGEYEIFDGKESRYLGVDSGRLWLMMAQFEIEVEIDAGFSGYWLMPANGRSEREMREYAENIGKVEATA